MILSNSCVLNDRYTIQSVLGEIGPLDVNYLAWDLKEEKEVVVREYYPVRLAKRARDGMLLEVHDAGLFEYGLGAYSAEGLQLTKLRHPNIAEGQEQFKQNGTVYCVHNFIPGAPLRAYLKQQDGRLSEEDAMPIIEKVLDALQVCHERKIYHGGISPKSVLVDASGNPMLLGFQAARFKLARECGCLADIIKEGFSAPEQTAFETEEGPWWDIYSAAATIFHMLTGQLLPPAHDGWSSSKLKVVLYSDAAISSAICDVLAKALSFEESERPASALELREMLVATQQRVTHQLHEGDGAPQFEIGYNRDADVNEAIWQNGVNVTAAKVKIETEAPAIPATLAEETEMVDSEMPNVIPAGKHQLLPASNGQDVAPEPSKPARSSEREQELEVLLTKMVKWQQVFVAFILGIVVIALLGLIGGVFFGANFFQKGDSAVTENVVASSQMPAAAGASVAASGIEADNLVGEIVDDDNTPAEEDDAATETASSSNASNNREQEEASSRTPERTAPVQSEPEPVIEEPAPVETPAVAQNTPAENTENTTESDASENDADQNTQAEEEPAASNEVAANNPFFTDEDLGVVSESVNDTEPPSASSASDNENLFHYYRVQGDSLMNQGFTTAALQWYQNALKYNTNDTYVNQQIEAIRSSIAAEARDKSMQDSLMARLEQVRDQNGIFIMPDTPVAILNEETIRSNITYPISALNGGVSGRVIIRYIVDEEGRLEDVTVVKGLGWGTEDVVVEQLRKGQFRPATFNGEAVKAWATFTTVFRMQNEE